MRIFSTGIGREAWRILTGAKTGDVDRESIAKVGKMVVGRVLLGYAEWGLMLLTATLVGVLKVYEISDFAIFAILWTGNVVVSLGIVFADKLSSADITFMEAYRRLAEKMLGFGLRIRMQSELRQSFWDKIKTDLFFCCIALGTVAVVVWLAFWLGSAYLAVFFRKELDSKTKLLGVVAVISAFQMFLWTLIYTSGVDLILSAR